MSDAVSETGAPAPAHRLRVLLAKVGLDGHDRGVKVIARLLRDEGYEVIYTGIRQKASVISRVAIDEDVDVLGLSILSGAHVRMTQDVLKALRDAGGETIKVIVGGTIPATDVQTLKDLGVDSVFGIGSSLEEIRMWFRDSAANENC